MHVTYFLSYVTYDVIFNGRCPIWVDLIQFCKSMSLFGKIQNSKTSLTKVAKLED